MRARRLLTALALVVTTVPLWVEPAGATISTTRTPTLTTTTTTTTQVTAVCSVTPPFSEPRTQDYTIVVTVPKRVSPGGTAAIHATVDYPVQPSVTAGAVSVVAHQGDKTAQQFIAVGAGSANIDGSASFPVTGPAGSDIVWEIQYFGQAAQFGGTSVSEVCRPTTPVTVSNSRIERSFRSRFPALARLAEQICNNPRSHFRAFAFLCALRAG
jgi:hypothetical protein